MDRKYEAIREGNLNAAFKPRGKSKTARKFPFWVELDPKGNDGRGKFEPYEHWPLIERIWQLARTMGGARIATARLAGIQGTITAIKAISSIGLVLSAFTVVASSAIAHPPTEG